jgi:hypothetical protein
MSNFDASSPTGLSDLASTEVMQLMTIHGGDPVMGSEMQNTLQSAVGAVSRANREAIAMADKLRSDDVMNPVGRDRMLGELGPNLSAVTESQLRQADIAIDILEAKHTATALHFNGVDAALLREEVNNYMQGATEADANLRLVQLATNPRFTTLLAGTFGESLGARFKVGHAAIHRAALQAVAINGDAIQMRAAKALAQIPAARRAVALARGGRDHVVRTLANGGRGSD